MKNRSLLFASLSRFFEPTANFIERSIFLCIFLSVNNLIKSPFGSGDGKKNQFSSKDEQGALVMKTNLTESRFPLPVIRNTTVNNSTESKEDGESSGEPDEPYHSQDGLPMESEFLLPVEMNSSSGEPDEGLGQSASDDGA